MALTFDDLVPESSTQTTIAESKKSTNRNIDFSDLIPTKTKGPPLKQASISKLDFSDLIPRSKILLKPEETMPTGLGYVAKEALKGTAKDIIRPFKDIAESQKWYWGEALPRATKEYFTAPPGEETLARQHGMLAGSVLLAGMLGKEAWNTLKNTPQGIRLLTSVQNLIKGKPKLTAEELRQVGRLAEAARMSPEIKKQLIQERMVTEPMAKAVTKPSVETEFRLPAVTSPIISRPISEPAAAQIISTLKPIPTYTEITPRPKTIKQKAEVLGIEKVPSAGFMQLGKGVSEIDKIQIEQEPKDLTGWKGFVKNYFAPVRHVVGNNPVANQIARKGRDTISSLTAEQSHYSERIDKSYKGLNEHEQELVTDYLEGKLPLETMPAKLKSAYTEANSIRTEMLQEFQAMGKDVSKWNITPEQYFPHIFVGSYQIKDGSKTIEGGFAKNLNEALVKAQLYLRDNPSADIKITPRQIMDEYSATLLSRKGFWRFISEVNKATELDRDEILGLIKGVAAIKPRGKFIGNLQQRSVNLGGYMKGPTALKIYVNRVLRKKWLDPFAKESTELVSQLPSALREYMSEYVDALRGKYNPIDNKYAISKNMAKITRLQSLLKLGYRPVSALINRLQPLQTAFAEIGSSLFTGGRWKKTAEGQKVLEESGVYGQIPKHYTGEFLATPKVPLRKPMGMFSKAEMTNREDVVSGGYLFAQKVFNMSKEKASRLGYDYILDYLNQYKDSHKAALEYAKDINADTNYIYDVSDLPKVFRTPFLKPALQFKTYPINFFSQSIKWLSETIKQPTPHNVARVIRFTGMNLLLAGPRSIPYVGRHLWRWLVFTPILGFINPKIRDKLARGVFSWLGVDLSQRLGPNEFIPKETSELLGGVLVRDLHNIYQALQGRKTWGQALSGLSGATRDIYEAIRSGSKIEDTNRRWRMIAEATGWEKALQSIGFPLLKKTLNSDMQWLITNITDEYKRQRARYIDGIIERRRKKLSFKDILKKAGAEGIQITPDDVMQEEKKKRMPALERRLKTTPKVLRREIAGLFGLERKR